MVNGALDPPRAYHDHRVIRLEGVLRSHDLAALAERLSGLADGTGVLLDWSRVLHMDYRGLTRLALQIRRLRAMGVTVHSLGMDAYLLALACLTLSLDEVEGLVGVPAAWAGSHADLASVFAPGLSEN